jgi:hypothetical protein
MTPEQRSIHDKLDALLTEGRHTRSLILTLTDKLNDVLARLSALERWRKKVRTWLAGPMREPMPTIDPDGSGSIEVGAFGAKVKATGLAPVRFAMVVSVLVALGGLAYLCHVSVARSAQAAGQERAQP